MTNGDAIRSADNEQLSEILAAIADWTYKVDFGNDEAAWQAWLEKEVV